MRWVVTLGVVVSARFGARVVRGRLDHDGDHDDPAAIRMPRVGGEDATRAEAILRAVGLKTSYIEVPNNAQPGTVLTQYPAYWFSRSERQQGNADDQRHARGTE